MAKNTAIFLSPCVCEGNHGVSRWAAKTDPAEPPVNSADLHAITPAEMYEWKAPEGNIPTKGGRLPIENQWFAMTGRLKKLRVEDDGDLHMSLGDPKGVNPFEIVAEIPLGERWCELRETVFSWTDAVFPFSSARRAFHLRGEPLITVIGKAFYDIDHSGSETSKNQRRYDNKTSTWEIHPVMRLQLGALSVGKFISPSPASSVAPVVAEPVSPAVAQATSPPEQFVTIMQPVAIHVPYGTVVLQPGTKLPVVSRSVGTVNVRYLNETYPVPSSATDAP